MHRLTGFSIIPSVETYPRLVELVKTVHGKLLLLVLFAFGLFLHGKGGWFVLTLIITAMTFFPQYRKIWLLIASMTWLSEFHWFSWELLLHFTSRVYIEQWFFKPLIVGLVLGFIAFYFYLSRNKQHIWLMKRPIRNLFLFYFLLLTIASYAPLPRIYQVYLWAFLIVLGRYIWFINYSLLDRFSKESSPFILQLGHYLPFWGSSYTPFPKGAAYLRKIEAKNPHELAISQLKGIKLLYWALLLLILKVILLELFYGNLPFSLKLPLFHEALHQHIKGETYPRFINWLSLIANFFIAMIRLSIWGHVIIATCRMAGYQALRNTYKPLQAMSIADFWNRYYYYFKELLVENFFYPAFLRYFKKRPKLRLFFAVVAAAGFGNVLYHFLRDINYIMSMGIWQALLSFHVYMFYGLLLGTAIGLSQLFEKKARQKVHWFKAKIIKPFYILFFYCILSIFDNPDRTLNISDHFSFLLTLFY